MIGEGMDKSSAEDYYESRFRLTELFKALYGVELIYQAHMELLPDLEIDEFPAWAAQNRRLLDVIDALQLGIDKHDALTTQLSIRMQAEESGHTSMSLDDHAGDINHVKGAGDQGFSIPGCRPPGIFASNSSTDSGTEGTTTNGSLNNN